MDKKSGNSKSAANKLAKNIRCKTRQMYSAVEWNMRQTTRTRKGFGTCIAARYNGPDRAGVIIWCGIDCAAAYGFTH